MEYHGKLYGRIGRKHFDTGVTSEDYDKLVETNKKLLAALEKAKREIPMQIGMRGHLNPTWKSIDTLLKESKKS